MTSRRSFLKAVAAFAVASSLPGFEKATAEESLEKISTIIPNEVLSDNRIETETYAVPIGYIMAFTPKYEGKLRPPVVYMIHSDQGWEPCIGQELLKTDYPKLHGVMNGAYGMTDTHFNMPDCRGMVV